LPDLKLTTRGRDRFIPVRKSDILDALIEHGAFVGNDACDKFRRLCEMLASIYHFEYFATLERLRSDYFYFDPAAAAHTVRDQALTERAYADLVQSLDRVLKVANFVELSHAEIGDAHSRRTVLPVEVHAPLDDFREVRFYRRGHHIEEFESVTWFGFRRRKVQVEVHDDVVLFAATKSKAELTAERWTRKLERRKITPGSVLLKYFHNIASGDVYALFPNARVLMSNVDKFVLGVPALATGIPILINLYTTITVLFLVLGFYLGVTASVRDSDMKTALAALSGLVALGGFVATQWVRYPRQSLKYRIELTDNIYYRNTNNNAGIFDYVIGAAEEQECKEAFVAYYFLHTAASPLAANDLDGRIEAWLQSTFRIDLDFEVADAVDKLERLGLLKRHGERFAAVPLDDAFTSLHSVWYKLFPAG
jgi:Protein of unknown function (DUF3754)